MKDEQNWVVVGANGGIGRAIFRQLRQQAGIGQLVGTARRHLSSTDQCAQHRLDYADASTAQAFVGWCQEHLDRIDRLVFATGALSIDECTPEKSVGDVAQKRLEDLYRINAAGPLAVTADLVPLLKRSADARVVVLSAQIGSIGDNRLGGWYGYRMAKAALNMGVKTLALETARWRSPPIVAAVHPGTTLTNLSERFVARRQPPPASAEETASRLIHFIDELTPAMSGGFFRTDGSPLPW